MFFNRTRLFARTSRNDRIRSKYNNNIIYISSPALRIRKSVKLECFFLKIFNFQENHFKDLVAANEVKNVAIIEKNVCLLNNNLYDIVYNTSLVYLYSIQK